MRLGRGTPARAGEVNEGGHEPRHVPAPISGDRFPT